MFSQWAQTLDIVESLLPGLPPPAVSGDDGGGGADAFADDGAWQAGREYFRFDGDISNSRRQHIVDHFNDPASSSRLLLCCTKAGGLGINLTGATRVVLFDTSWNPQADQQVPWGSGRGLC